MPHSIDISAEPNMCVSRPLVSEIVPAKGTRATPRTAEPRPMKGAKRERLRMRVHARRKAAPACPSLDIGSRASPDGRAGDVEQADKADGPSTSSRAETGVPKTSTCALHMSAFDPKRTSSRPRFVVTILLFSIWGGPHGGDSGSPQFFGDSSRVGVASRICRRTECSEAHPYRLAYGPAGTQPNALRQGYAQNPWLSLVTSREKI